ncbi:MAG: nitrilase-related carbon-nitrogen hydrolase [Rhodospirillaceae bacterium]|nr:nitrilase-related carbon-nitrogen hydrolase [Rhodospirillaceae bacterium]
MPQSDVDGLKVNRRRLLLSAGVGAAALPLAAQAAHPRISTATSTPRPLRREVVSVAAIQLRSQPGATQANLRRMVEAIDRAQSSGPKDLIAFPADALQGAPAMSLADLERSAIALDGPECAALAQSARTHGCYVSFGALAREAHWPGHVLSLSILIGPDGAIVAKDWAAIAEADAPHVTTIDRVLDRYVEMYGPDAVLPAHRTDIGNIAFASSRDPDVLRALALKGAEIVVRTGAVPAWDARAAAAHNHVFGIVVNSAVEPDAVDGAVRTHSRGTAVYGPSGEVLAEAGESWQQIVTARLPLAYVRETRPTPTMATALVLPVYQAHHAAKTGELS